MRTDDMTKVTGAFRDCANEPTKHKHGDYCSADCVKKAALTFVANK